MASYYNAVTKLIVFHRVGIIGEKICKFNQENLLPLEKAQNTNTDPDNLTYEEGSQVTGNHTHCQVVDTHTTDHDCGNECTRTLAEDSHDANDHDT